MRDDGDDDGAAAATGLLPAGPVRRALLAAAEARGRPDALIPLAAWLVAAMRPGAVSLAGLGDGTVPLAILRALAAEGLPARCAVPEAGSLPPLLEDAPEAAGIERVPDAGWPPAAPGALAIADLDGGASPEHAAAAARAPGAAILRGAPPDEEAAPAAGRPTLRLPGIEGVRVLLPEGDPALGPLAALAPDDPDLIALAQLMRVPPPALTEEEATALLDLHRGDAAGAMIARSYALAHHAREAEIARRAEGRARGELWHARRERDEARAHLDALLGSTSWRALEPARRLVRRVRGAGEAP